MLINSLTNINKIVELTITTVEFNQSIEHIDLLNTSIDHILLIGGTSELPIIRRTLEKKYACVVDERFYHFNHPMNLVVLGALQAYYNQIYNIERKNDNMDKKIKGCIVGGAIGDALGYPIEFANNIQEREHTRFDYIGLFSDDTQMTLFTAEGLIYQKKHNISYDEAIYQAYLDWYDTQRETHLGKNICKIKSYHQLNHRRAPGNTCLSALSSGSMGTIEQPLNNSKGCGGVMRVAPVGIVCDDITEAGKIGATAGAITHGHPLGIIPCYVFSAMISILIHSDKNIEEALDLAMQNYIDHFDVFDKEYQKSFVSLINKAKELSKHDYKDTLAIPLIGGGWVGDEALAIAIYACLKYDNFEDAIICAANHDGDSDSTGAIAGNIMGAYLGYDKIPDYYKDNIEAKNILLEMSDALVNIARNENE